MVRTGDGVGDISLAHFGLIGNNDCLNARPYLSIVALWPQYTHLLMTVSSRIMLHITKLKSVIYVIYDLKWPWNG